jgi:cytoskeleton protein RodZ
VFEIGSSLREARVRKGLDFPQIEAATKIRGKYLRALEDEQFELLPSETYIKGFLRTYAEYLGLDGQLYVDEFNSRYVAVEEQPIRAQRTARPRRHRRFQRGVLLAALAGIALVTALVIAAWKSGSPSSQHVPGLATRTTGGSKPKPATRPALPPKPTIVLRAVGGPAFLIAVRKNSPTGQVLFEGKDLSAGQMIVFRRRKLWIDTGTPEHLRVIVDGRQTSLPGGKPQVFVVTARGVFASAS